MTPPSLPDHGEDCARGCIIVLNMSDNSAQDPLAGLAELPGVPEAVAQANDHLARLHRHPANLRGWDVTGAESVPVSYTHLTLPTILRV